VLASFPDMEAARDAIRALGQAGVDGGDIALLGPEAEEAARPEHDHERESGALEDVARGAAKGAAVGAPAGAAAAAATAGALSIAVPGVGTLVGSGLLGAWFGGGIGAITGGVSRMSPSDAWELTYASVSERRCVVGVHSEAPETLAKAEGVLAEREPLRLGRFDAEGRALG